MRKTLKNHLKGDVPDNLSKDIDEIRLQYDDDNFARSEYPPHVKKVAQAFVFLGADERRLYPGTVNRKDLAVAARKYRLTVKFLERILYGRR